MDCGRKDGLKRKRTRYDAWEEKKGVINKQGERIKIEIEDQKTGREKQRRGRKIERET